LQEGGGPIDPEGLHRSSNSPRDRLAHLPSGTLAWIPLRELLLGLVHTPPERNRLVLRETAATLLYRLQGRTNVL
jgi:hypothetical protein